jgi:hypothetical protein
MGGGHCSKTLTERGDDCFDFVFGFPRCETCYKIKTTNRLLTEAWNQEKRGLPFGVNTAMRINKDERAVRAVGIYRVITIVKDGVHDVWQRLSFFQSFFVFPGHRLWRERLLEKKTTKKCDERSVLLCPTERKNVWSVITVTGLPFLDVQKLYRYVVASEFFYVRK